MDEEIVITGKLRLDTSDAEKQLNDLSANADSISPSVVKDAEVKLPKKVTADLQSIFTGPKGLNSITKVANGLSGGLRGLTSSFMQLAPVLALIGTLLLIVKKLLAGTDTMQAMMDSFSTLIDSLRTVLAPILVWVGDLFITLSNALAAIMPVLEPIVALIMVILQPLLDIFKILVTLVSVGLQPLIWALKPVTALLNTFTVGITKLLSILTLGLINLDASSTGVKSAGYSSSLDTWETSTTGETSNKSLEALLNISKLVEYIRIILQSVKQAIDASVGWIVAAFDSVVNFFKGVWNSITSFFTNIWNGLVNVFNAVINFFRSLWDGIVNFFKGIGNFFSGIWNGITGLFGFAGGGTIGGQVWSMNEKGNPEFVFNSGGSDTVINAAILENAMYNAVVKALGPNQQKIEVSIKEGTPSGPRELVQWLLPSLKFSLK